jgi:site-specific DNA recombinase
MLPRCREEDAQPIGPLRCAVYTRKSTEEDLNQEFNSLDAQREAAEAYIASQRQLGWILVSERYDDGGFSGGNLERPALQRLLGNIEQGNIDCILVYKLDRLSRSLLDFARLAEVFERHQVNLVSVTQPLNTTTSLGRLTVNILVSYAQFEREMIADRTRDKMAASRRKGKWVGGRPVLGYDVAITGGRLVVNTEESSRVQEIFALYLQHGSLDSVLAEVQARQWTTKRWRTREGKGISVGRSRSHFNAAAEECTLPGSGVASGGGVWRRTGCHSGEGCLGSGERNTHQRAVWVLCGRGAIRRGEKDSALRKTSDCGG